MNKCFLAGTLGIIKISHCGPELIHTFEIKVLFSGLRDKLPACIGRNAKPVSFFSENSAIE